MQTQCCYIRLFKQMDQCLKRSCLHSLGSQTNKPIITLHVKLGLEEVFDMKKKVNLPLKVRGHSFKPNIAWISDVKTYSAAYAILPHWMHTSIDTSDTNCQITSSWMISIHNYSIILKLFSFQSLYVIITLSGKNKMCWQGKIQQKTHCFSTDEAKFQR